MHQFDSGKRNRSIRRIGRRASRVCTSTTRPVASSLARCRSWLTRSSIRPSRASRTSRRRWRTSGKDRVKRDDATCQRLLKLSALQSRTQTSHLASGGSWRVRIQKFRPDADLRPLDKPTFSSANEARNQDASRASMKSRGASAPPGVRQRVVHEGLQLRSLLPPAGVVQVEPRKRR